MYSTYTKGGYKANFNTSGVLLHSTACLLSPTVDHYKYTMLHCYSMLHQYGCRCVQQTIDNITSEGYWGERSEPCTSEVNANSVCMYRPTCMYVIDRPVALRMRRNMLSTCCSCARPTNALHSPSNMAAGASVVSRARRFYGRPTHLRLYYVMKRWLTAL